MNESILNHLFLPHHLPSSAADDFLSQSNYQNEHMLLERMKEYLVSFASINPMNTLPIFRILTDCIQRWSSLQNHQTISVLNLQAAIKQLTSGSFLPLYFHAQNAAILIEIDNKNTNQPIISAWQVLLPTAEITSSLMPHLSCFPVTTYRLDDRSQLISIVHCELLKDFMFNTVEYSKSFKASHKVSEIRDVPESHYVCQWWIQQFQGLKIENKSYQFKKKHRDQIRWNNALLPFRRSGLWMTIKVVFHTILIKRLGRVGNIIYKLLITDFLTYIIDNTKPTSTDLLVHCTRKIVRRLNKIESLLSSRNSNGMNEWIQHMKQKIQMKVDQIFPKSDWQRSIQTNDENNQKLTLTNLEINHPEIYQHLCREFKAYLDRQNSKEAFKPLSNMNNYDDFIDVNQADYIPSYDILIKQFNYTVEIALTRMEIWVESCLEQWINYSSLSINGKNRFEILLHFFEEYQNVALTHYYSKNSSTDPIGYSRFILTSLSIIRYMHEKLCNDPRFTRLQMHCIDIPNLINLFEFLILPKREDMIRARNLYNYLRQFNNKPYPDLLTDIIAENTFGVYFASQTPTMIENIQKIRAQAEQDKQDKIIEVNNAKKRYQELINSIRNLSCSCPSKYSYWSTCHTCKVQQEAKNIQVKIFECPIPSTHNDALAVIFELQMPIEIRCYRDILWQFINRPEPNPQTDMYKWLNVFPHQSKLGPFYTGPSNCKVKLVSSTKSATQSHYSSPSIASTPVEGFLFENGLKVQISPNKSIKFDDECRILTPKLDHADYKQLQFTINTTQFLQNDVIAKLSDCSPNMKPTQFIEFGSFRSGHRLQWWNLLTIFEMDSLSIAEESVAILITHSILQYGPLISNLDTSFNSWCSESHEYLLEDHFIDEFILRLNRHLDDCELNWQNELLLMVITMITMRLLTICNTTRINQLTDLILKCRKIGEKWINLISISIQTITPSAINEVEKLRSKMVNIGITCLLTFSTDQDRINDLLSTNGHIISLLKATTTIHDNIILNKNQSSMSTFMKNIMRFSEYISVMIQPTVANFLKNTSYQSLNEFSAIYWAVIKTKGQMNGQWKKRKENDLYDG